jgi:phosphatidylserine/phosphatidylglycerophosphate/cardiolipin synthase-like enzyme
MHWLCCARLSRAALLVGIVGLLAGHGFAATTSSPARVSVCFSPNGECTDVVVRELNAAQKRVLVQAYSFTSAPIAKALTDAHRRGVKILAVLDKSNETARYSAATFLTNAGIPTLIDDKHAIAHSKVMVIDDTTVITGSFNFTKAAEEKNAENLVVLKDAPDLVKAYERNINEHAAHSHSYRSSGGSSTSASEPQDASTGGKIHGNKNSKIYHLPGCPGYSRLSPASKVTFRSEAEAVGAGYRRAKNCRGE